MFAIGYGNRRLDLGKLLRLVVRLGCPHLADLFYKRLIFGRRFGEPGIILAGILNVSVEDRVLNFTIPYKSGSAAVVVPDDPSCIEPGSVREVL